MSRDLAHTPEETTEIVRDIISEDKFEPRPDPSEVWDAFDRICASRAMAGCHRLVQLLEYVVRSTLQGEAAHLKETTIGVAVFGRNPDYDPKLDTIVRSQAWRLRSKLRKYYAGEGAHDRVVIELPVGHYVPIFRVQE